MELRTQVPAGARYGLVGWPPDQRSWPGSSASNLRRPPAVAVAVVTTSFAIVTELCAAPA
ncbi:hypothetical protein ACFCYB_37485 [Streptomyces sp. NPDC056309]|uniref:hypothetical protein n=1 Tax=unclassified Streptomyces TaxID=2593676 RepID=UPI0035DEF7F6